MQYTHMPSCGQGASGGVMVRKLDLQTYTSEFESHWVPLSYGLVPQLSKKLSKFPHALTWLSLTMCECVCANGQM